MPYNPYLTKKYGAHINVEVCTSIKSVKYLYTYIHKGHDRAAVELVQLDEIRQFVDARYVGPPEACWRLMSFDMHGKSHVVERLPVHLPGKQSVLFEPDVIELAPAQDTKLTAYFKLIRAGWRAHGRMQDEPGSKDLNYEDVPCFFTWKQKTSTWLPRQKGTQRPILGRVFAVPPVDQDRFYLRMLLMNTPNVANFEGEGGLRLHTGESWREAAERRGLVDTDNEYHLALEEAATTHMPGHLRQLFVQLIVFCDPSDKMALWDAHKEELSADHIRRSRTAEEGHGAALYDIDMLLQSHGRTLTQFGFEPPPGFDERDYKNRALRQAMAFDASAEAREAEWRVPMLTDEQRIVFDTVLESITSDATRDRPQAFFVDGPGGSGKTFLYETLVHHTRGLNKITLACAMSGIAAMLLPGGTTAHSLFGLPLDMADRAESSIKAQESRAEVLRRASLIVWDEASMISLEAVDCVDRLLRDPMDNALPFGCKVILLGGDFRQILPVVPKAQEAEIIAKTILNHYTFREHVMRRFSLTRNMRVHCQSNEDETFRDWLLQLGGGRLPNVEEHHPHTVELPTPHLHTRGKLHARLHRVGLPRAKQPRSLMFAGPRPHRGRCVVQGQSHPHSTQCGVQGNQ